MKNMGYGPGEPSTGTGWVWVSARRLGKQELSTKGNHKCIYEICLTNICTDILSQK